MSKITITYNKVEYDLSYTRQTIKTMESQGFDLNELASKPATMIPMLFEGAFMRFNRGIKRSLMDEIWEDIKDKSGLIGALAELYSETLSTLIGDNEAEGNATWVMVK